MLFRRNTTVPKRLDSLEAAMEWVKAKRLRELYAQFPPLYARLEPHRTWWGIPAMTASSLIIPLAIGHALGYRGLEIAWLVPWMVVMFSAELFLPLAARYLWMRENIDHPYLLMRTRDAAIARVTDHTAVAQAAAEELERFVSRALPHDELRTGRDPHVQDFARVRIAADLVGLKDQAAQPPAAAPDSEGTSSEDVHGPSLATRYERLVDNVNARLASQKP